MFKVDYMRILLIEDNQGDAVLIETRLRRIKPEEWVTGEAIELKWIKSLEEAEDTLAKESFDIVFLDLGLGKTKGLETLDKFFEINDQLPVIVLTGNIDTKLRLEAIKKGAQDYLVKDELNESMLFQTLFYAIERSRLQQKVLASNRELENFAYVASHDLREPLRKVINFGTRLKEKYRSQLDERGQEYIDIMHGASLRMRNLLDALLEYSRTGTREMKFETVDLQQIMTEIIFDLDERIKETHARIEIINDLPKLKAEPGLLRDLFQNLITNALKFKKEDQPPSINIKSERDGSNWEILISDNGIGFDPELKEKIFGQFMKVHGKDEYEGHGMGLATCDKIAQRHDGSIVAESRPGEGSSFKVILPVK